jgi:excisionase family DNA binding protein
VSSKIEEKRGDLSVQQALQGKKGPAAEASGEDDLTRLIRIIARQAAREAFAVFKASLEASGVSDPPLLDRLMQVASEGRAANERASPDPGERFLSVAEVAKRLGVSEKTVRRKIETGDLTAHRVGKLIRVREHVLTAYLAQAGRRKG